MKIFSLTTRRATGMHRAPGRARTADPDDYLPRHCAGTSCFHGHADGSLAPVPTFPGSDEARVVEGEAVVLSRITGGAA